MRLHRHARRFDTDLRARVDGQGHASLVFGRACGIVPGSRARRLQGCNAGFQGVDGGFEVANLFDVAVELLPWNEPGLSEERLYLVGYQRADIAET